MIFIENCCGNKRCLVSKYFWKTNSSGLWMRWTFRVILFLKQSTTHIDLYVNCGNLCQQLPYTSCNVFKQYIHNFMLLQISILVVGKTIIHSEFPLSLHVLVDQRVAVYQRLVLEASTFH